MDKKRKFTKRKIIVISILIIILIAIIAGILFIINRSIPIQDITEDNISINLSTTNPTGKNIIANTSTKTNYDIFYFIDYSAGEEQYYEDDELLNDIDEIDENDYDNTISNSTNTSNSTSNNTIVENTITNTTNSIINTSSNKEIKQISDKEYIKVNNSKFTIENNGIIYLKYGKYGKLSSTPYVFEVSNIDKEGPEIGELETTSTNSSITVTASAIDKNISNLQYYFKLSDSETYISTGSTNSYTFKNLEKNKSYIICVKVVDKFGNESEAVTEETVGSTNSNETTNEKEVIVQKIYHFKVNLEANTVTVYEKDDNGKFTKPVKAFICSTGKATPKSGTYKISVRYRWRSLFGGVYGQYAVRIHGNILFHSVPYEKMSPNSLEYEEYDKLGTSASMGCIRLCVQDAKWIYDNAKAGSTVEFYSNSSDPGPLGKPKAQKISNNKNNRNWDPTDPDKHNPWNGGDGKVTTVNIEKNSNSNKDTNNIKNTTNTNTVNNIINNNIIDNNSINSNSIDNSITNEVPTNTTSNSTTNLPKEIPTNNTTNTTNTPPSNTTVEEPENPQTNNNINENNNTNNTISTSSSSTDSTNTVTEPEPEEQPDSEPSTSNNDKDIELPVDNSIE